MGEFKQIDLKVGVAALARDRLSEHKSVREAWEKLVDSSSKTAFQAVAEQGTRGPKDVAEDNDKSASTVRNWFSDLNNWDDFGPIYRSEGGGYRLSTAGKYYAAHYADLNEEKGKDTEFPNQEIEKEDQRSDKANEENEVGEVHEQQDLGNSDERPADQTEESAADAQSAATTKHDQEGTREKADKLFDEVSASRSSDTVE